VNIVEKYPWLSQFKIPKEKIELWNKKPKSSLTFYCLKKRILDKKKYFNWAKDYYQIPSVNDMYFEHSLMKKKEWNDIKDLYDWTEEILPISIWKGTIFVGCVELSDKIPKKLLDYEVRVVLVSQKSLETTWNFISTLSSIIEKTHASHNIYLEENHQKEKESSQVKENVDIPSKKEEPSSSPLKLSTTNYKQDVKQNTFNPDIPSKKEEPTSSPLKLSTTNYKQDVKQNIFNPDIPVKKEEPTSSPLKLSTTDEYKKNHVVSQTKFPEEITNARRTDSESNQTFPNRSLNDEEGDFFMKKGHSGIKLEDEKKELSKETTSFSKIVIDEVDYNKLWNYAKKHYCCSLVFDVKEDKAYLKFFIGTLNKLSDKDNFCMDLKEHSLFKIVYEKEKAYNGFVIDSKANKKFFESLGWSEYPQYVTALPVKNSSNKLDQIFFGISLKTFSKQEIQDVQRDILEIFSKNKTLNLAS